ncbi:MAG: DUF4330 family protein [Candidatus Omnitrophica bacterium]|nr:DUF4330 family protein [Candidatus Omnitrophota bacterium]MDD5652720.1 DUF4330 family protein [Candidatus Omnitrophota bacterium]
MKIIDEKGRLFGKVNIIDFLVIFLLLLFIPGIYYGHKIFKKPVDKMSNRRSFVEIEIPCIFIKVKPETLKLMAAGDKEFNLKGDQLGEISELGKSKPYQYKFYVSGEDPNLKLPLIKEDPLLKEVPAKLKIKAEIINNKDLFYKERQIKLDAPLEFKTSQYVVEAIPFNEIQKEKLIPVRVNVNFSGLSPELSDLVSEGHIEKNNEGKIIGTLKEVLDKKPSQIQALKLEENKLVVISDPYRTDMIAVLDLLCSERDGVLYFKNYPVKIGGQIIFSSKLYIISGIITGISFTDKNDPPDLDK